jgi:hypothetical protein
MEKTFTTQEELANTLKNFKGSSLCTMEITTKVKTNKKSRVNKVPFAETFEGDIYRTYKESGNFNISYENAVNNQRVRENNADKFVAKSLVWGEWFADNKIITHKDNYYLRYYVGMHANSNADKNSVYHYADGSKLSEFEVACLSEYLPPKKAKSKTQDTIKEISPRAIKINGINKLKVGGVTYTKA